jgi:autotransporter-associated beta strand protein
MPLAVVIERATFRKHIMKLLFRGTIHFCLLLACLSASSANAQVTRLLGLDISAWQGNIAQATWNNIRTNENRHFIILRSSRGGTTGYYNQNDSDNSDGLNTLSQRYDDPYYVQNINRVPAAGMYVGSYHFSRPDIIATTTNSGGIPNSGTDEADHFIQMAGPWMRPGYLVPVHDLEAGDGIRTDNDMAQFSIDFSDRIYTVMGIRPAIYINGNYAEFILGGATSSLRNQLAQPSTNPPTPVSPAAPQLWSARWPNQAAPNSIDVQNGEPKDSYTPIYGPWDDYGTTHPWTFWQYASTGRLPSFMSGTANLDFDVVRGGIEFLKDQLVPAVWMNDASGSWSTLINWNSGQTPIAPVQGPGQVARVGTLTMPTPRLPGAAGSGTTSGQHDTVILERPNTNITVTLSSGTHNIRKLYQRETLNITGGSLVVLFAPSSDSTTNGAQFSGPVTLSGSAVFSVHTLQVDAAQTFTLNGGTVMLNTINLMPGTTPAKLSIGGSIGFSPLTNSASVIASGSGAGAQGFIDLTGGTRVFGISDGTAEVDLSVNVAITNGALTKAGFGTMSLNAANSYAGGTTVTTGRLLVNNTTNSGTGTGGVTVSGGYLGGTGTISGAVTVNSNGTIAPGTASAIGKLTLGSAPVFSGTNFSRINRNGGSPVFDQLALTSGTLNYGGTLVISNAGAALVGGEVFTNFSAASYSGAFASTILPTNSAGLNWHLGRLTTDGTIRVNRAPVANTDNVTNAPTYVLEIPIASLLTNDTDADTDTLSVSGITLTTTNGITLTTNATTIFYSNSVSVSDRFNYTISDASGGNATGAVQITSLPITNLPPSISTQPQSQTVKLGSNVTFSVVATGTPTPGYQWQFNGSPISGATSSIYIRSSAQFTDAGNYSVLVTNIAGSPVSSNAALTVLPLAPMWVQSITPLPDGRMTLVVTGEPGYVYSVDYSTNLALWQQITNLMNTNGTSSFTDHSATNSDAGFYRARQ